MSSHIGVELPFGLGVTSATVTEGYHDGDHGSSDSSFDLILNYSIDFAVPNGTPITAEGNGTVVSIVQNIADSSVYDTRKGQDHGFGNLVTVQYDNGYFATYMHLQQNSVTNNGLHAGSRVHIGQAIGNVGLTGATFGPHIHVTYGLTDEQMSILSGNKNDSTLVANGSISSSGPPVYLMATSNGLPPPDKSTIHSDNLMDYATSVPPVVKAVALNGTYNGYAVESVGVNQANNMQGWFYAGDASGDGIGWWALYDQGTQPNAGHFSVSSGQYYNSHGQLVNFSGQVPMNTVVVVSTATLNSAVFVGGNQNGKFDYIDVAAMNNSSQWSAWQVMLVATQTTPTRVQDVGTHGVVVSSSHGTPSTSEAMGQYGGGSAPKLAISDFDQFAFALHSTAFPELTPLEHYAEQFHATLNGTVSHSHMLSSHDVTAASWHPADDFVPSSHGYSILDDPYVF